MMEQSEIVVAVGGSYYFFHIDKLITEKFKNMMIQRDYFRIY
jgi:hypothetical protein